MKHRSVIRLPTLILLIVPWIGVGAVHLFIQDRGYYDWLLKTVHGGRYLDNEGVLFQHHVNEGGIVALKMVLDRLGVAATKDELLRHAGIAPHGTTMLGLQRAARAKGLHAAGRRLTLAALRHTPLPAIVVFNRDQYGVVTGFTDDGDLIMLDPRWGRLSWTAAEFNAVWGGETLLISR